MRLALLIAGLFILFGSSACQTAEVPAFDEAADREAILAQSKELSEAYMAGNIARLVRVYTEDGIAAPAGRDFIGGREALERLWNLPEGRTVLRHESTPVELVIDGNHAYDRGYYSGQAAQDGIWRLVVDMWYNLPIEN